MTEKDGTTADKAICLNSDDEDMMSNNDNNNNEEEEDGDDLSYEDVSSVYNSGSDLHTDHSSSDDARTPPLTTGDWQIEPYAKRKKRTEFYVISQLKSITMVRLDIAVSYINK
jgi:hypothetical protein